MQTAELRLEPFDQLYASVLAGWVQDDEQLRLFAPSATLPLSAAKIAGWRKPGGHALVLSRDGDGMPVAYGELNPMPREQHHFWLGHVIVDPARRRQGVGVILVRRLLRHAFEALDALRISLVVFPENTAAVRCYRRAGFIETGEEWHQFREAEPRQRLLRFELKRAAVQAR